MTFAALVVLAAPPLAIDLDGDGYRQVVVDREPGRYLGHPSTVLLADGRTIFVVYPAGHGRGPILLKRSDDGGRSWGQRLPTPTSWETSLETPTIHALVDPKTRRTRLIVWSALHPARRAVSEDLGKTWSALEPVGTWGGIVVMGFVERVRGGDYLAMFHDDGRFFTPTAQTSSRFTLYQTRTHDGGLTWTFPEAIYSASDIQLCEPGVVRSPDGRTLAVLLRENARKFASQVIFSHDEGRTWSLPRALPMELTGDRHVARYAPDGRLVVTFRDMPLGDSAWKGDWVAWVGRWQDIVENRPGQYRVRLKDNMNSWDCGYAGLEVLRDGTFVGTSYGHWKVDEEPYVISVRFKLSDLDARAR